MNPQIPIAVFQQLKGFAPFLSWVQYRHHHPELFRFSTTSKRVPKSTKTTENGSVSVSATLFLLTKYEDIWKFNETDFYSGKVHLFDIYPEPDCAYQAPKTSPSATIVLTLPKDTCGIILRYHYQNLILNEVPDCCANADNS